jgi:predicted phosphodiesterase
MPEPRNGVLNMRVYISFAEEDRRVVRGLEARLRAEHFDTWFDEKDLTLGMNWKDEVKQALPRCDVFLSCISTSSVSRRGFYEEEIAIALALRSERPGFVIPVRLDKCELPAVYRDAHLTWVDLFNEAIGTRIDDAGLDAAGLNRLVQDLRRRAELRRVRDGVPTGPSSERTTKLIRILHLSDLHFKRGDDHENLLEILDEDLKSDIDFLVVSGDLSDKCNENGYQQSDEFLCKLRERRKIPQARCILVPGNHDVQRDLDCFEIREKIDDKDDAIKVMTGDMEKIYLVRRASSYADRFSRFAAVHQRFTGRDYDLTSPKNQVCVVVSNTHRLQFLGLNSAWRIDQFRPQRSSIHTGALDSGLRSLKENKGYLGIAVWHHAVTGNNKISNDVFLARLSKHGVRLCLHGDVHELRPDIVSPYSTSRIHVVGTGSFGAVAADRPESTPRMYNLIEIGDDLTRAHVSTRQQPMSGAPFQAYATWSIPGQRDVRSGRYEITLDPLVSNTD